MGMKSKKRKLITVWRMDSDENKLEIPLEINNDAKILYPAKSRCEIGKTGKSLTICLPDKYSAVIIEL
jgi:hypothetical protein